MLKNILFLLIVTCMFACGHIINKKDLKLNTDKKYPKWLTLNGYSSEQTSGIAYLGNTAAGKEFLLADDTGLLHRMVLNDSEIVSLKPVFLSEEVQKYLSIFPKKDFEEIVYDKYTGLVYLSVEGNGINPAAFTGIYKLNFKNGDIHADTVLSVEKLQFKPHELFTKYIAPNIAYEGLTVDENYFYLGLEGFSAIGPLFADSTIIFAADKKTLKIVKEINTRNAGIHTICGLYSDVNNSLYGIDRNNKKVFHLQLNDNLEIIDTTFADPVTSIPGYPEFSYVTALESIAIDDNGYIYLIDDPWKTFFIPSADVLSRLDSSTVNNFRNFVPVLYKYKIN